MSSHGSDDDVQTQSALRLLPPRIAEAIRHTSDHHALRHFACACASLALSACNIEEPLLNQALSLAWNSKTSAADEFVHIRQEVTEKVEQLDDLAFQAQETLNRHSGRREEYTAAFRAARAATSVLCAIEQTATRAAAEACYEAMHAIDGSQSEETLLKIAQQELGRSDL